MANAVRGIVGFLPLKLGNNLYVRRSNEEPWSRGIPKRYVLM
jgi:hypothetical protein